MDKEYIVLEGGILSTLVNAVNTRLAESDIAVVGGITVTKLETGYLYHQVLVRR
jgi:hypothetical protein